MKARNGHGKENSRRPNTKKHTTSGMGAGHQKQNERITNKKEKQDGMEKGQNNKNPKRNIETENGLKDGE